MRIIIAAVSPDGVIGVDNELPWDYPEDLRRFRRRTLGATVVMGRNTFKSMDCVPLKGRRNIIVSKRCQTTTHCYLACRGDISRVSCVSTVLELTKDERNVFFIGGAEIYKEAMPHCDMIELTLVPDEVPTRGAVMFPNINREDWVSSGLLPHPDPRLSLQYYLRRKK